MTKKLLLVEVPDGYVLGHSIGAYTHPSSGHFSNTSLNIKEITLPSETDISAILIKYLAANTGYPVSAAANEILNKILNQ